MQEQKTLICEYFYRYIKGFMLRNEPECEENKGFIHFTRYNYLIRLRDNLPKTVLDKSWIDAPKLVKEVCLQMTSWIVVEMHELCFLYDGELVLILSWSDLDLI